MTKKTFDCYECKYRRGVSGDTHSRCVHPAIKPVKNEPF